MKRDKNYKAWVKFIFWKTVVHMYGRHEFKEVILYIYHIESILCNHG